MNHSLKVFTVTALASALAACGGGGSGDGDSTGTASFDLTDAAVDSVQAVNITVVGVELQPADGERISFDVENPDLENINLLDLQNGSVEALLSDQELPAGEYEWIRLKLGDQSTFTVIDDNGGTNDLFVPSGDQRGLQTSGFVVPAGGTVNFTIDFDVRKSLVNPPGLNSYLLKPVLRLVDNAEVGTIKGTIGQTLLSTCEDANSYAGGVYIYEGSDVTPDDLGSENEPLVVAPVDTESGDYDYTAAFLPAGDYTVAYTCDMDERQDEDGNMIDEDLDFTPGVNAEVIEGEETTVDLTAAD
ncbi:DUF4382 domain-containing protein [Marinobacter sp. HL-58]|uniref:DUF4382 domain-containing protein n=1 Tax=Marinobacter sp. HL-58 TaxID=1479237 RepID=UPI000485EFA1|nr:DUF4382 domain-containing protein [Marinobacter sp. HL-58]KPP99204.1 MAG: protein of unknown function containing DUF4382 domain [Marinobacter sp. HL-58]